MPPASSRTPNSSPGPSVTTPAPSPTRATRRQNPHRPPQPRPRISQRRRGNHARANTRPGLPAHPLLRRAQRRQGRARLPRGPGQNRSGETRRHFRRHRRVHRKKSGLRQTVERNARKKPRQIAPAQIELLGKISSFEVTRQIKLASVVVVPSLFDAFSRALVESLILGRPVVTTDQVGAASLVEQHQCGLVVPAADPAALALAIDAPPRFRVALRRQRPPARPSSPPRILPPNRSPASSSTTFPKSRPAEI